MKKLFCLILFLTFGIDAYATLLTGTVKDPGGTGITGRITFQLAQQGAVYSTGACPGPFVVVPVTPVSFTLTAGAMSGTPTIVGNDCIQPANTYYIVTVRDAQGNILFQEHWTVTGTTMDVGTVVPTSTAGTAFSGAVLLSPPFNTTQSIGSAIVPLTNNAYDLGTPTGPLKWRDGWFSRSVQAGVDVRVGTAGGVGGLDALTVDGSNLAVGDSFTGTGRWDSIEFFPGSSTYQARFSRGGLQLNTVDTTPTCVSGSAFIYFDGANLQMCNGTTGPTLIGGGSGGTSFFTRASGTIHPSTINDRILTGVASSDISDTGVLISNNFLYAISGATNADVGALGYDAGSSTIRLASGKTGSASYIPLAFLTSATERARFLTNGTMLFNGTATDAAGGAFSILSMNEAIGFATAASNASTLSFGGVAGSQVGLNAGRTGTGTRLPMAFFTGGAETARFDTSNNLLVGLSTNDDTVQIPFMAYRSNAFGTYILSRNDSVGSTAYAAVTAREGNSTSTNDVAMGVTSSGFSTSPLSASQGFLSTGASASGGLFIKTTASSPLLFGTTNTEVARFTPSGIFMVGLPTSDVPASGGEAIFKGYIYVANAQSNAVVGSVAIDAGIGNIVVLASGKTGSASYTPIRVRTGGTDWFGFETDGGFHIVGSNAGNSAVGAGAFRFNLSTNKMQLSENNGPWVNVTNGFAAGQLNVSGSNNLSLLNMSVLTTGSAPYVMLETVAPDGTTVLIPAWRKP